MYENLDAVVAKLNPAQQEAVKHTEGPLLVVAGAGSGKTRMLTVRIAWLVEKCAVLPYKILAVTFTNKAAKEMRDRVNSLVAGAESIRLATFHSFCCLLLRQYHNYAGFEQGFTIYDEQDSEKLMKQVLKELNLDPKRYPPKQLLEKISAAKNELIKPEDYFSYAANSMSEDISSKVYKKYQEMLAENRALDFDDLIFKAYYMLLENDELLKKLQNRYSYFLVDEYQDTNHAQYKIMALLSSASKNICVVGDEDQSIYSWRGATIRNIQKFEEDFPGATVIKLEQNYRSTQIILDAAGAVISNNKSAHPKMLWTDKKGGNPILFFKALDDRTEAETVIQQILALKSDKFSFSDFAVLFRMNSLSRQVEQALKQHKISYDYAGGTKFFDRREVKDIIAYLKVINNPNDTVAIERIINVPKRGIGAGTLNKVKEMATQGEKKLTLWEAVSYTAMQSGKSKVADFFKIMLSFMEAAENLSVSELCRFIISEIDYNTYLTDSEPETAEDRISNIESLVSDVSYQELDNPQLSLAEYLETVALYASADSVDEASDKVQLMTIHNAKGLEFPVIFVVGMEEGIFPYYSAFDSLDELEEERRLAYVAMTRAKEHLIFTATHSRLMFGTWSRNPTSRFIDEIPAELFESANKKKKSSAYGKPQYGFKKWSDSKPTTDQDNFSGLELGNMVNLKPGIRVRHEIFGNGIIEDIEGDTLTEFRITANFDQSGRKKMLLQYTALWIINSNISQEV